MRMTGLGCAAAAQTSLETSAENVHFMRRVRLIHWNEAEAKQRAKLLRAAGYEDIRHVPFSLWNVNSCMVARRPASADAGTPSTAPEAPSRSRVACS